MKREMIKQINEHLDKLQGVSEKHQDLSEKERADCLSSVNWILINQAEILQAQLEHTTNEHTDNIKYMKLLKAIMQ